MSRRLTNRCISIILVLFMVSASFMVFIPLNSTATPSFDTPEIEPEYPNATEPVNVTVNIEDSDNIANATLYYSYDGSTWHNTTMSLSLGGVGGSLFNETFPSTTLDTSNWASSGGSPTINTLGINEPSTPYSLDLDGNTDLVTTVAMDLSPYSDVSINFSYEPGGGGNNPESGDRLYLDYYTSGSSWVNIWSANGGGGIWNVFYKTGITLPAGAHHPNFRFRFRVLGTSPDYDDWFLDDISMNIPSAKAEGVIPGPGSSAWVHYYINATNQIGEWCESPVYTYYADGSPPIVVNFTSMISPSNSQENMTVFANVTDKYFLGYASLWYDDGSGWTSTVMNMVSGNDTNATYQAEIPNVGNETTVFYYIQVFDRASNSNLSAIKNFTTNLPPAIRDIVQAPLYPNGTSVVTLCANVTDNDGIGSVTLFYSTDGLVYSSIPMSVSSGNVYAGTIPAVSYTTTVFYYIDAQDSNGMVNSTQIFTYLVDADPPEFGTTSINPLNPNITEDVNVTMAIIDDSNLADAVLYYSSDGSTWYSTPMVDFGQSGVFYEYYVESGTSGWTHYPISGPAGDDWVISTTRRTSPTHSWYSGPEPLNNWGDSCLESPLFTNLATYTNLTFWHWYDFYSFAIDGGIVEINDGSGWVQIYPVDGYDATLGIGWQNPLEGKEAFTANSGGWQKETFELSAYTGKDVRIRFHVGWNNINDGPKEGWYIDDIALSSDIGGCSSIIPGPGFSTWMYYYVIASDQANNTNISSTYSYFVDGNQPSVIDTSDVTSPVVTNLEVPILANVTDDYGLDFSSVYLWYDNGSGWTSAQMSYISGNYTNATFKAVIPQTGLETVVSYYVEVMDNASNANISTIKGYQTNLPPFIENVSHMPQYPNGSTPVDVYAHLTDSDGIGSATLYYSPDNITFTPIPMSLFSGNMYNGTIPGLGSNQVYYYIETTDTYGFLNSTSVFSYLIDGEPPAFNIPYITPEQPSTTDDVEVSIGISDNIDIDCATLYYSYDGTTWMQVGMNLTGSTSGTVSMLAYTQYADMFTEYPNTLSAINQVTTDYVLTEFSDWTQLDSYIGGKDVLLIPEQEGSNLGTMESIGSNWAPTLTNFLNGGGTIIVCDDWGDSYGILTGAGLMTISGGGGFSGQAYVVDPTDPLADSVSSSFNAPNGAKRFTTAETNVVIDDGGTQPVVINKAYGAGFIALIGFDYFSTNPDASQVVGNAVFYSGRYGATGTIPGPGYPTEVYYYIQAQDHAGNSNTSGTYSYFVGSNLILTPENITFYPYPSENGTAVQINALIHNSGGGLANVEVRFYDGDPDINDDNIIDVDAREIGTPDTFNIPANSAAMTSTSWTPTQRGCYEIYVWIDPINTTWEWNELDNLASSNLDVYHWLDNFLDETKIDYKYDVAVSNGVTTLRNMGNQIEVNGTSNQYSVGGWGSDYFAQSFVATDPMLSSVGIYIGGDSNPYPDMRVQLWNDNGGNPDRNDVMATGDVIDGSKITSSGQRYYIYFSPPLTVTVGQTYWVVIDGYYDHNTTGDCKARRNTANVYPDGIFKYSFNAGFNWFIASSNYDLDFVVTFFDPVSEGDVRSVTVTLPIGKTWETLYINKTEPINTYIYISVLDGSTNDPLSGYTDISADIIDISPIDPELYPTIKLFAHLVGDGASTPILDYWALNWVPSPKARAGPDDYVDEDVPYTFNGSASWSSLGIVEYTWDIDAGDGLDWINPDYQGPVLWDPTHTYDTPGIYVVTLNVTDVNGYWDTDTVVITVNDITPPEVDAGQDDSTDEDAIYNFDAGGSVDNSGTIVSYLWDMDASDGADPSNPDYSGVSISHTYSEPGTYTVWLFVSDAAGNWNSTSIIIIVFDITAPSADAGSDGSIKEDDTYFFDGTGSSDNVAIIFYNWTFGDGYFEYGINPTPQHTYTHEGIYAANLRVTDDEGNWDEDSLTIYVNNVPPIADAGENKTENQGDQVTFDGSGCQDTPSDVPSLNYIWYFGDGTVGSGKVVNHVYSTVGNYIVTLVVNDNNGDSSSDTLSVQVIDGLPPLADCGNDATIYQNSAHTFDGSGSYDNCGIANYAWDVNASDGFDWANPDYSGPDKEAPVHTYLQPGVYTVTLNVTDTSGYWDTDQVTITVVDSERPIAVAGEDGFVDQNLPYQFDGGGSTDNTGIVMYLWDVDDSDGIDWSEPDYTEASPVHIFTEPEHYVVTLKVVDSDWNSGIDSITIIVNQTEIEENVPCAPTDLEVLLAGTDEALELRWTEPTTNMDGSPLTDLLGYEIYFRIREGGTFSKLTDITPKTTSYLHTGLTPNSTCYYYIVAIDTSNTHSSPSNMVSGTPNIDTDGDQIPDISDADDDGDGHPDSQDDYPLDSTRWKKSEAGFDWFWILVILIVILFCIIILLVLKPLKKHEKEVKKISVDMPAPAAGVSEKEPLGDPYDLPPAWAALYYGEELPEKPPEEPEKLPEEASEASHPSPPPPPMSQETSPEEMTADEVAGRSVEGAEGFGPKTTAAMVPTIGHEDQEPKEEIEGRVGTQEDGTPIPPPASGIGGEQEPQTAEGEPETPRENVQWIVEDTESPETAKAPVELVFDEDQGEPVTPPEPEPITQEEQSGTEISGEVPEPALEQPAIEGETEGAPVESAPPPEQEAITHEEITEPAIEEEQMTPKEEIDAQQLAPDTLLEETQQPPVQEDVPPPPDKPVAEEPKKAPPPRPPKNWKLKPEE